MFLYLKSLVESEDQKFLQRIGLEEGGRLIPSGVIYVKADISDTTVQHAVEEDAMNAMKKKQTRRGMILDDAESIAAMNKDFTPVKFKKDGDPDSRYVKYLYTHEKWEEICEKMSTSVKEVSTRMEEGEISAKPDSASPCSYCKFSPVCRNAKK